MIFKNRSSPFGVERVVCKERQFLLFYLVATRTKNASNLTFDVHVLIAAG